MLKLSKYKFYTQEVVFLRYVITLEGIKIDPSKVDIVLKQETLKNVKDIQLFLRFTNFYKRFIKDYLIITILLISLIKKDIEFKQNSKARKAFLQLKVVFTQHLVLIAFNLEKEIIIEIDTSNFTLSTILSQLGE